MHTQGTFFALPHAGLTSPILTKFTAFLRRLTVLKQEAKEDLERKESQLLYSCLRAAYELLATKVAMLCCELRPHELTTLLPHRSWPAAKHQRCRTNQEQLQLGCCSYNCVL